VVPVYITQHGQTGAQAGVGRFFAILEYIDDFYLGPQTSSQLEAHPYGLVTARTAIGSNQKVLEEGFHKLTCLQTALYELGYLLASVN
jgi:hypothetical protein